MIQDNTFHEKLLNKQKLPLVHYVKILCTTIVIKITEVIVISTLYKKYTKNQHNNQCSDFIILLIIVTVCGLLSSKSVRFRAFCRVVLMCTYVGCHLVQS